MPALLITSSLSGTEDGCWLAEMTPLNTHRGWGGQLSAGHNLLATGTILKSGISWLELGLHRETKIVKD